MIRKIIIGLISSDQVNCEKDINKVIKIFTDVGFYRTSISSKTKEIAKYLLPGNIFPEETLDKIRSKGYTVSKCYWVNLVLASVPDDKNLIIIDDIRKEDIIENVIFPYILCDSENHMIDGIEAINFNSQELDNDIHKKIKRVASNKNHV